MNSANSEPPVQSTVADWANSFSIVHPVLADTGQDVSGFVTTGFPTYVVIDKELVIRNADMWPWNDSEVLSLF